MRLLPRSAKGTWLLAAAAWMGLCGFVWELLPPRPRGTLDHPGASPWMYSPDGRIVVTLRSKDNGHPLSTAFWEAETGRPFAPLATLPADCSVQSFSCDGRWVLVYHQPDRNVSGRDQLWDLASGKQAINWGSCIPVKFSPTQPLLAAGTDSSEHPRIQLIDLPSLTVRAELPDVNFPAFSSSGRLLATITPDSNHVTVWSVKTGRPVVTVPARVGGFGQTVFTPDDQALITSVSVNSQVGLGPKDLEISVWNLPEGTERFRILGEELADPCRSGLLITMPDLGLPFKSPGGGPKAYDLQTGVGAPFNSPATEFLMGNLGPTTGGPWMAKRTEEPSLYDRVREWLSSRGVPVSPSRGHRPAVHVADAGTGRIIARLPDHTSPLLSPTGTTLATVNESGLPEIWDIPPRKPLTWFTLAAVVLALPFAWLARRRVRRLRSLAGTTS